MAQSAAKRQKTDDSPKSGTPFEPAVKVRRESPAVLDVKELRPAGVDTFRILTGADRRTLPSITRFERSAGRGIRAQQLASGGDTTAQCSDDITEPMMLSEEEMKQVAPVYYLRPVDYQHGTVFEKFHMNELEPLILPVMQGFDRNALPL